MAQKQVRICDRCDKQQDHVSTTDWTVVKIALPALDGKEREDTYDLCDKCTYGFRCFINDYVRPPEEIKT